MTAIFKNFKVTAKYYGDDKPAPWNVQNANHHRVYVTNVDNGKRTSFDFWASIMEPELESEYDVLNAFYCFVSDAISGEMDAIEFNREFCYKDPRKALKVWRACQNANKKLKRIYDGDIYELANELAENYG